MIINTIKRTAARKMMQNRVAGAVRANFVDSAGIVVPAELAHAIDDRVGDQQGAPVCSVRCRPTKGVQDRIRLGLRAGAACQQPHDQRPGCHTATE